MPDEIEIMVTEIDPDTGARRTIRVKLEKTGDDEIELTADGKSKTLDRVRKREPQPPTPEDPIRVGGHYHVPIGDDRNITFVLHCDRTPPQLEVVVTYAEGDDIGQRDAAHCTTYEISRRECERLHLFIHDLHVPPLVALGPALGRELFVHSWVGPSLTALAHNLDAAARAIRESRPAWHDLGRGRIAFVPLTPGVSIIFARERDQLRLEVRTSPAAAAAEDVITPGD